MSEFRIDKGVSIPAPKPFYNQAKYPWREMQVGDSFCVSRNNGQSIERLQQKINSAGFNYGKRHNKKFVTRQVEGGVRIWRVS